MILTSWIHNAGVGRQFELAKQSDFDRIPMESVLLGILFLIKILPLGIENQASKRGRPYVFSTKTILACLVVMLWTHRGSVRSLYWYLSQNMKTNIKVRKACGLEKVPHRKTFDRRFSTLPMEDIISAMGRCFLVYKFINAVVVAIDSTIMSAWRGLVHHKKDKEAGKKPRPGIDTDGEWTKKHGTYRFGYKCHQITSTGPVPVPLAATTTPANVADNKVAPELLEQLPLSVIKAILGDQAYRDKKLFLSVKESTSKENGGMGGLLLTWVKKVSPKRGKGGRKPGPQTKAQMGEQAMAESDDYYLKGGGDKVYAKRSTSIEPEQGRLKEAFGLDRVPVRGKKAVNQYVLGCIFTYQLAIFYGFATKRENPLQIKYLIGS